MSGVNDLDLTLYFVGEDEDEAQQNFPFDSYESAESYQQDNPGTKIYEADAVVDFTTMRLADED